MPELPEVELVARALHNAVAGRHISTAELYRPRLAPHSSADEFAVKLSGCSIMSVRRRGKNILFDLDNGVTLLTHLRMSGRFMLLPDESEYPKFTHAAFELADGFRLVFQDQRHFGLMKVIASDVLHHDASIAKLGPEPFSEGFTVEYLSESLRRSGKSLKEFLLDQTRVCGLGNIYASEAMFLARISPRRLARNVRRSTVEPLFTSIRSVLDEALRLGESRVPDPVIIGEGIYGSGVSAEWKVYGQEGRPCNDCTTPIRRIRQGARSTYYCPKCQR